MQPEARIRIDDLPSVEHLTAEELAAIFGAGRRASLDLESLEGREVPAVVSANVINFEGDRILDIRGNNSSSNVTISQSGNNIVVRDSVNGFSKTIPISPTQLRAAQFVGGSSADRVVMNISSLSLQAWGYGGNDYLEGYNAADRLFGGAGNDTLVGYGGNDLLYGGINNDILRGGADNDRLFGEAGRDNLQGGSGNDYLSGGADYDVLDGGSGSTTYGNLALTDTAGITALTINQKILNFARNSLGSTVRPDQGGDCYDFVAEALRRSGAKVNTHAGAGTINNQVHHIWGTTVYQKSKLAGWSNKGYLSNIKPGDAIQFDGCKFVNGGYWQKTSHHSAIVESVNTTTGVIKVIHQNIGGVHKVFRGEYNVNQLQTGVMTIYRPQAA